MILLLDDDVTLHPLALETLERAYLRLSSDRSWNLAGIRFRMVYADGGRSIMNSLMALLGADAPHTERVFA